MTGAPTDLDTTRHEPPTGTSDIFISPGESNRQALTNKRKKIGRYITESLLAASVGGIITMLVWQQVGSPDLSNTEAQAMVKSTTGSQAAIQTQAFIHPEIANKFEPTSEFMEAPKNDLHEEAVDLATDDIQPMDPTPMDSAEIKAPEAMSTMSSSAEADDAQKKYLTFAPVEMQPVANLPAPVEPKTFDAMPIMAQANASEPTPVAAVTEATKVAAIEPKVAESTTEAMSQTPVVTPPVMAAVKSVVAPAEKAKYKIEAHAVAFTKVEPAVEVAKPTPKMAAKSTATPAAKVVSLTKVASKEASTGHSVTTVAKTETKAAPAKVFSLAKAAVPKKTVPVAAAKSDDQTVTKQAQLTNSVPKAATKHASTAAVKHETTVAKVAPAAPIPAAPAAPAAPTQSVKNNFPQIQEDGQYLVTAGSYSNVLGAERVHQKLKDAGIPIRLRKSTRHDKTLYHLLTGPFATTELATKAVTEIKKLTDINARYLTMQTSNKQVAAKKPAEVVKPVVAQSKSVHDKKVATIKPVQKPESAVKSVPSKKVIAKPVTNDSSTQVSKQVVLTPHTGDYVATAGSFSNPDNAMQLRQRLEQRGLSAYTKMALVDGKEYTHVILGPFSNRVEANKTIDVIQKEIGVMAKAFQVH